MFLYDRVNYIIIIIITLSFGCAAYVLDNAQTNIRKSFASADYDGTASLVSKYKNDGTYNSKDHVLMHLEMGTATHFAKNYEESNASFERAEYEIEDLFSKSISRGIASFLVNDNVLAYDGEDYEDIYINAFKALNFIHLYDLEAALVEARRVSYKLSQLNYKYNDIITALSNADTSKIDEDKWKSGKTNLQNSAFGHYLSAILFAKTGKIDDARISYNRFISSSQEQPSSKDDYAETWSSLETITQPNSYNLLVQVFTGQSPYKSQHDLELFIEETNTYLKYSLPKLNLFNSSVSTVRISINESETNKILHTIEHLDVVAKEVYKVKEPIIYARTIVRASLKAIATQAASKEIKEKDETLGKVFKFLGNVAQNATEKADLRGWQTMPGVVHGTVLKLPIGTHTITIEYLSESGAVVHTDVQEVNIQTESGLELLESIYWN